MLKKINTGLLAVFALGALLFACKNDPLPDDTDNRVELTAGQAVSVPATATSADVEFTAPSTVSGLAVSDFEVSGGASITNVSFANNTVTVSVGFPANVSDSEVVYTVRVSPDSAKITCTGSVSISQVAAGGSAGKILLSAGEGRTVVSNATSGIVTFIAATSVAGKGLSVNDFSVDNGAQITWVTGATTISVTASFPANEDVDEKTFNVSVNSASNIVAGSDTVAITQLSANDLRVGISARNGATVNDYTATSASVTFTATTEPRLTPTADDFTIRGKTLSGAEPSVDSVSVSTTGNRIVTVNVSFGTNKDGLQKIYTVGVNPASETFLDNNNVKVTVTHGVEPNEFPVPAKDPAKEYHGNPIITSIYSADPSAHVWPTHPDRIFLYPSQDLYPARGCDFMDQYHVYSTDNMIDWVDHGMILQRDDLEGRPDWGSRYQDTNFMWAPDAAYSESAPGKGPYFFIFPVVDMADSPSGNWGDNWTLGVAWSDKPYAGFRDNDIVKLRDKNGNIIKGSGRLIDPCFFYDEDEDAHYLIVGGSQELRIARLNSDMVSLAEDWHVYSSSQVPQFHEGPWMFTRINKYGDKLYYLMYPGGGGSGSSDNLVYCTSETSPYGPWSFQGSILGNVGTGDTSHGSIVEFKDQWYIFYHTADRSGGAGNLRSVAVEQLFFYDDGIIKKAAVTNYGAPQIDGTLRTNLSTLKTELGAGDDADNWKIELTFNEYLEWKEEQDRLNYPANTNDYTLDRAYVVANLNRASLEDADETTELIINAAAYESVSQAVEYFDRAGSYAEFLKVNGGAGGYALLGVNYSALNGGGMTLHINGERSSIPLQFKSTGGWQTYTGNAYVRIELRSGDNTIRLSGGALNLRSISIYFPE